MINYACNGISVTENVYIFGSIFLQNANCAMPPLIPLNISLENCVGYVCQYVLNVLLW